MVIDKEWVLFLKNACSGLDIDEDKFIQQSIEKLAADFATKEGKDALILRAASKIANNPSYDKLAVRLLLKKINDEVFSIGVHSFYDAMKIAKEECLISDKLWESAQKYKDKIDVIIDYNLDNNFTYFGLQTVYDRYLLKHPTSRKIIEKPQYLFLRVALGVYDDFNKVHELYRLMAQFDYLPGSPTLFNAGTKNPQLSSCFLADSPKDSIEGIYDGYRDVARLSKHGGGIGISYSRVRSRGSLIRGTNGRSSGILPWLKTLDSSVAAVNQGGRRKGACCVYLETWHADIESFLELKDNTGDESQRTHNLNIANWIPNLFMKRVEKDEIWSLFDPAIVPGLCDAYGAEFEDIYEESERKNLFTKQVKARDLYGRMMKTLAQTGNGWITFKDRSNETSNQTGFSKKNVIHLSNLCTEILEVNNEEETSVCNLGSINLSRHINEHGVDYEKISQTAKKAIRQLDTVIDKTFYPIEKAAFSNSRWRPVGLGIMGLQDVFFALKIPFDSADAKTTTKKIAEEIYLSALEESIQLAKEFGAHQTFKETKSFSGTLQPDLWGISPINKNRYDEIKSKLKLYGIRNSLLIAIAPTATIASIVGCYECIEPQVSNIFKRETLSGEFLQVNKYLVKDLMGMGIWSEELLSNIIHNNGSIQSIEEIPSSLKQIYKTAWELPQKVLIDMAIARGPYIDQSQSLNLFMETPNIGKLSSMYFYAWQQGIKTCYYLRSRPATQIAKTNVFSNKLEKAVSCSLENPGACEACD